MDPLNSCVALIAFARSEMSDQPTETLRHGAELTSTNKQNDMPLNPQQSLFRDLYLDPASATFSNARGSAIAAGYDDAYAGHIGSDSQENLWFKEIKRDLEMITGAEEALYEAVHFDLDQSRNKTAAAMARVKLDAAKFVAKAFKKEKYSELNKTDMTSNGETIGVITLPARHVVDSPEETN